MPAFYIETVFGYSLAMFWVNLAFSTAVFCSFLSLWRGPRSETSWILSMGVSAFYGPCLGIGIALAALSMGVAGESAWALVPAALVLLFVTWKKWRVAKTYSPGFKVAWGLRFFTVPVSIPRPDLTVSVKAHDGQSIPVDFYIHSRSEAPLVFFLFGGGFVNQDQRQHPRFLHELRQRGCHVAAIGYRQLPGFPWPQSIDDVEACIRAAMIDLPKGVRPADFHLMGRSAGGFLAVHASRLSYPRPIKTCSAIYPVTDLQLWSEEEISNAVLESRRRVRQLTEGNDETAKKASLLRQTFPHSVRYLIVSGDADPVVDVRQTMKLAEVLKHQGNACECLILPTESHGFDFNLNSWASRFFLSSWSALVDQ